VLERAIAEAYAAGHLGPDVQGSGKRVDAVLHRGAGAYICGEETALLNSLEGLRGQPRLRPPFPAVEGLFASPTVINNVETLMNVPDILVRGADWFRVASRYSNHASASSINNSSSASRFDAIAATSRSTMRAMLGPGSDDMPVAARSRSLALVRLRDPAETDARFDGQHC